MSARFTVGWLESHRVDVSTLGRADIVGIGHVLAEVDALVARLSEPDRAAAMGLTPPRGILLHGAPGLGKTLVARYLAASLGDVPFYEVASDELTPERIRGSLRHLARSHPRSVLYADEIDGIGMDRDWAGHDADTRQRLTSLLAALDGLTPTEGPVVIASSNRPPEFLDPALVRSGRLGFRIEFGLPNEAERQQLVALFLRRHGGGAVDAAQAARLTRGRTPADLRQLVEDAASLAFTDGRTTVATVDLVEAVRRGGSIRPEVEDAGLHRHRVAVHEAGHVAAGVALRGPEWVRLVEAGLHGGRTACGEEWEDGGIALTDDAARDSLVVAFAGIAAEQELLGEASLSGEDDVTAATDRAVARIAAGVGSHAVPVDLDYLGRRASSALRVAFSADVAAQVESARGLASAIVRANRQPIAKFAAALEEAGELAGEPLRQAIEEAAFVRALRTN